MTFEAFVGVGALGTIVALGLARRFPEVERPAFSAGLLLAAVWYLGFGVVDARGADDLVPQAGAGLVFAAFALAGFRGSYLAVGLGWLLHIVWDLVGLAFLDVSYAPHWTVPACMGWDAPVGIYLVLRSRGAFAHPGGRVTGHDSAPAEQAS